MVEPASTTELDKVIEKVRKLLALSGSPSEAEAHSAMEKAHSLLKQYNLSMEAVTGEAQPLTDGVYLEGAVIRTWKKILLHAIAEYNYCGVYAHILRNYGPNSARPQVSTSLRLVGKKLDVLVAKLMADYLFHTVDRLAKRFEVKEQKLGPSGVESYKFGLAETMINRLRALRKKDIVESSDSRALVVQSNKEIEDFFKDRNMDKTDLEADKDDRWAWAQGRRDANDIGLDPQVDRPEEREKIE